MAADTLAAPAATDRISFEEFLSAYDGVHAEWIDGEVTLMTPNTDQHSRLLRFLSGILQPYAEEKQLGEVFVPAYAMWLGDRRAGREPDVFFVAREHGARVQRTFLDGPADLVIEIISADSRGRDRGDKFYEYETAGVPEYWLIDPERRKVEAYRLGDDATYEPVSLGEPAVLRPNALPGAWIPVEWLWQEPMPHVTAVLKEWGLI